MTREEQRREYARHHAESQPELYSFVEFTDQSWELLTEDHYVADWGPR